jgi:hypothetical protein
MSMNYRFSRGYGGVKALAPRLVCCYSNTESAEVLLLQQRSTIPIVGQHA